MNETSGVLRPVVEAYLNGFVLSLEESAKTKLVTEIKARRNGMFLCLLVSLVLQAAAQPQPNPTQPPPSDLRHQIHSKKAQHLGVPGMIQNDLKTRSGDIELPWLFSAPMYVVLLDDPQGNMVNMACVNDLAVLGKIESGESHPTADQSYIYTDWTLTVEEVIKDNPKSPVLPKQNIVFVRPGGTIKIDGRRIHARTWGGLEFHNGAEVLLYLKYLPETGTYSLNDDGFVFTDSKSFDLDTAKHGGQFDTMTKNDVLDIARKTSAATCVQRGGQQ